MGPSIGKRIIVIGSSNAGKSTLAHCLAERLGVPLIELDALHWEPGWVEAERAVFCERVRRAIAPASWVMCPGRLGHPAVSRGALIVVMQAAEDRDRVDSPESLPLGRSPG